MTMHNLEIRCINKMHYFIVCHFPEYAYKFFKVSILLYLIDDCNFFPGGYFPFDEYFLLFSLIYEGIISCVHVQFMSE